MPSGQPPCCDHRCCRHNTTREKFYLRGCGSEFLHAIFQSLASASDSVSRLGLVTFDGSEGVDRSDAEAMQPYLQSATNIAVSLELVDIYFGSRTGQILDGLRNENSVEQLTFFSCKIGPSEGAEQKFATVLRTKPNLTTLRFVGSFNFFSFPSIVDALQDLLTRRRSPLKCFDVEVDGASLSVTEFQTLMTAVTKSTLLEHLVIGNIRISNEGYFEALEAFIPSIKATEITLLFSTDVEEDEEEEDEDEEAEEEEDDDDEEKEDEEERLMQSLKRNYNVQSVTVKFDGTEVPWLNETNQARLKFYLKRNRKLARWTANPKLVPRELWSYAMTLALKAGMNPLFQSLVALSGQGVGLRDKSRKRKRPQSFDPSVYANNK